MAVSDLQMSVPPYDVYVLLQPVLPVDVSVLETNCAALDCWTCLFYVRTSEYLGMSTFFRCITKSVLSLFRGFFSEKKFR
jgi:hypothetical protein